MMVRVTVPAGEDDAAVLVVPGVGLVLAQDRELNAVDGFELFEGEFQGQRRQDVDLDQGLAAGEIGAQGAVAVPGRGQVGEEAIRQPGVGFGPAVGAEGVVPAIMP